ncbi:MAG: RagB/SusD family nutrient uptake outer membrane protein, partial [Gemmatimonadaceae bacterium]
ASCTSPVIGSAARGTYMQSNWFHRRWAGHAAYTPGTAVRTAVPYILAAESDLIRAEALIRSGGSKATAATLINNSRVTRGTLSALTGAETNAVMLTAVDYERQVELLTTGGFELMHARQGLTSRLQTGTWRHLPIPAKELETLGLPIYTFGGPGKEQ